MKEFNLEEAKQGAKICTRDGHKARIVCYDVNNDYPIVALVDDGGREVASLYTQKGRFHKGLDYHDKDLMLVTEKHEGWMLALLDIDTSSIRTYGRVYDTKEQALEVKNAMGNITVVKIEWED